MEAWTKEGKSRKTEKKKALKAAVCATPSRTSVWLLEINWNVLAVFSFAVSEKWNVLCCWVCFTNRDAEELKAGFLKKRVEHWNMLEAKWCQTLVNLNWILIIYVYCDFVYCICTVSSRIFIYLFFSLVNMMLLKFLSYSFTVLKIFILGSVSLFL